MKTLEPLWVVNPQSSDLQRAFFFHGTVSSREFVKETKHNIPGETVAAQSRGTFGVWNREEKVASQDLPTDGGTVYYLKLVPNAASPHLLGDGKQAKLTDNLVYFVITESSLNAGPLSLVSMMRMERCWLLTHCALL